MDFKRYSKLIIVIMVFIFAITIGAIIYNIVVGENTAENTNSEKSMVADLYFIDSTNPENPTLKSESRTIYVKTDSDTEIIRKVLEELKAGPKNSSYKKSIPDSVNILEAVIDKETKTVNVDLSSEYNQLKASDAVFSRVALVYTLTSLDFVQKVKVLADGQELLKANGEVMGAESKDDISIGDIISPEPVNQETVKLYFASKDLSGLITEEREIKYNPNQAITSKAKYIMEQLIAGPKNSELLATVPSQTKIRDVRIRDGVCYVDLSKDFVDQHPGGSTNEYLTIESIVNSLTEIDEVKKVQFLVEGEQQQEYKGHIDISKPIERETGD